MRMRRAVVGLLAVALLLALAAPAVALAKDFSIDTIGIASSIDPNGDLRVTEDRTVTFDGQFTWVEWALSEIGSQGIEVLGVSTVSGGSENKLQRVDGVATAPGTYSVNDLSGTVTVHVSNPADNETITYRIAYVARGAAKRYLDVAELYWKFIGDQTAKPTGPVKIVIAPPAPLTKEQVRAWAHGPLTGTVTIGPDGTVTLDVPRVPANTFVEARVLYPASVLPQASVTVEKHADTVLAEEAKWAKDANAARLRAQAGLVLGIGLSVLLSLAALGFAIWAFVRHGREYRAAFPGGYLREDPRPDLQPGVVGSVWRLGAPTTADIAATLMDLADKGVIAMRPTVVHSDGVLGIGAKDTPSFELGLNPKVPDGRVEPTDQILLDLLFKEIGMGGRVTLEEIKAYAKDHPKSYTERIQEWSDGCEALASELGMFESQSWSWRVGMFVLAGVVGVVGFIATFVTTTFWPACFAVPSAAIIAVIGVFMVRRSREGNELYAQYRAVRDFLRDFSRLHEAPPQSIVLWNRFLVLAVVFGIAAEVINDLRAVAPNIVSDPGFQTSYWWVYSGGGSSSPVSSLQSGFASASQIATSAMSSASGGGGGFSGGGGGGGGGGGFSAG